MIIALLLSQLAAAGPESRIGLEALHQKIGHLGQAHRRAEMALRDFDRELDAAVAAGKEDFLQTSGAYRQLLALREIKAADLESIGTALAELGPPAQRSLEAGLASLGGETASALAADIEANFGVELTPQAAESPALRLQLMPYLFDLEVAQAAARLEFEKSKDLPVRPGTGPEGNMTGANFPEGTWSLTFDDGPSAKYTKQVVDALTAHGKKASFFWLAENVAAHRSIVDYAKRAGMSLNDHSFTHLDLSKASAADLQHEIVESAALEARYYGARPEFFRCPYGAGTRKPEVRGLIAQEGMIHVFWNVDSLDWQDKDPSMILGRVKKQMTLEKKGIILFHDIHPQSLEAAKMLLDFAGSRPALRWRTIPQMRDELNGT